MAMTKNQYIRRLIKDCEEALAAKPIGSALLKGSGTNPPRLDAVVSFRCAIYVFREIGGKPETTFERLQEYKKVNVERSCPRLNSPSQVLYVGSSIGNVGQRLRQHVGLTKVRRTYALHIDQWFGGEYEIEVLKYCISQRALQILEDAISFELRPAFGKMGGNNAV